MALSTACFRQGRHEHHRRTIYGSEIRYINVGPWRPGRPSAGRGETPIPNGPTLDGRSAQTGNVPSFGPTPAVHVPRTSRIRGRIWTTRDDPYTYTQRHSIRPHEQS